MEFSRFLALEGLDVWDGGGKRALGQGISRPNNDRLLWGEVNHRGRNISVIIGLLLSPSLHDSGALTALKTPFQAGGDAGILLTDMLKSIQTSPEKLGKIPPMYLTVPDNPQIGIGPFS